MKRYICFIIICMMFSSCYNKNTSLQQEETSLFTNVSTESSAEEVAYKIEKTEIIETDTIKEDIVWIVGKAISMDFTVDGDPSKFKSIAIDGMHFYSNGYTLKEDGKVISIPANYFDNYAELGEHILTVKYEDGEAITTFIIELEKLSPMQGYYQYPSVSEGESAGKKIEKYRIKQNVLDSMNDEQLAQAVVDYPALLLINLYDSKQQGANVIAKYADAYAELLRRGTAKDELIAKMKEISKDETVEILTKYYLFDLLDGESSFESEFTEEDRQYIEDIRVLYD